MNEHFSPESGVLLKSNALIEAKCILAQIMYGTGIAGDCPEVPNRGPVSPHRLIWERARNKQNPHSCSFAQFASELRHNHLFLAMPARPCNPPQPWATQR